MCQVSVRHVIVKAEPVTVSCLFSKSKQIVNCCHPNALMTLKEYLEDYASPETKEVGEALIKKELEVITNPKVKEKATEYIEKIHEDNGDFRF